MLMGDQKNYVGYFQFFVVEVLSVEALLGINEIHRHGLRINTEAGFAYHDKVGKLLTNLIYKTPYDFGSIQTEGELEDEYEGLQRENRQKTYSGNAATEGNVRALEAKGETHTVGVLQEDEEFDEELEQAKAPTVSLQTDNDKDEDI